MSCPCPICKLIELRRLEGREPTEEEMSDAIEETDKLIKLSTKEEKV